LSDKEPSDEQLHLLMKSVLEDVKVRSDAAQKKFEELQKKQIMEAKERFKNRQSFNEHKKTYSNCCCWAKWFRKDFCNNPNIET
jgi:hypothetical protein